MADPVEFQSRDRLVLDLGRIGIPEVPTVGRYRYSRAQVGLQQHHHPGAMEICFLSKGTQLYRVGATDYLLRGGDVFVTFPDEIHSTGEAPQEKGVLYWIILILRPEARSRSSALLNCGRAEGRQLAKHLLAIRRRHFGGSPLMEELLENVLRLAVTNDPLRNIRITTHLVQFLLEVLECEKKQPRSAVSPRISELLRYIESHVEERLSVDDLARRAELSASRLKTRFKQEVGLPPAEYVQRMKIDAARRLLSKRQQSVTEIAFRLGYSSSQHFATVFKQYTGMTPTHWLGRNRGVGGAG
jgi:AraC-like DNA-binding protein